MNLVVVEAGGSKTELQFSINGKLGTKSGGGINPYFLTDEEMYDRLKALFPAEWSTLQIFVYFYGAGCQNDEQKSRVAIVVQRILPNAQIEVNHDMLAAAKALCWNKSGVVCILGTGSNACVFNGKSIENQLISLGFWLGDEGSGGYLGKLLFSDWLKELMPPELAEKFTTIVPWKKSVALQELYKNPNPNSIIASLARFCFEHRGQPWIEAKIYQSTRAFFSEIEALVSPYYGWELHFTGTIAYMLRDDLPPHIARLGLVSGRIIANPSEALFQYHLEN